MVANILPMLQSPQIYFWIVNLSIEQPQTRKTGKYYP